MSPATAPTGHAAVMPLDHLVYAVPTLDEAVSDLEGRLGVRAGRGGRHPGRGTHNALLSLGVGRYLEIIATDPGQPAPPGPRPFGVDAGGPPRLAGWAWRTDDIARAVAAARREGYDPGEPVEMSRVTEDGTRLEWRLTLNSVAGGPVPFLIDWGETPHPSRAAPDGVTLVSYRVEHPDPVTMARTLAALGADADIVEGAAPALVAVLEGPRGRIRLS